MPSRMQKYKISHRTHYEYSSPSTLCHNQTHLRPRDLSYQCVHQSNVSISPLPDSRFQWLDSFGNRAEFFSIEQLHPNLTVKAESIVERSVPEYHLENCPSWRDAQQLARYPTDELDRQASEFLFDSSHCMRGREFLDYARSVAIDSRSLVDCVYSLMSQIHRDFEYSPDSTQVNTPANESLAKRQGVCQDFAHVAICCLRSLGIPARYVSGYLLTHPALGEEKLVGADASHAWFSVYAGPLGWIDFDPTNNVMPGLEHVTVAWGRDYGDVAPIHGVFVGGGFTLLTVSVDVQPI